jgi:hypothetical protein
MVTSITKKKKTSQGSPSPSKFQDEEILIADLHNKSAKKKEVSRNNVITSVERVRFVEDEAYVEDAYSRVQSQLKHGNDETKKLSSSLTGSAPIVINITLSDYKSVKYLLEDPYPHNEIPHWYPSYLPKSEDCILTNFEQVFVPIVFAYI